MKPQFTQARKIIFNSATHILLSLPVLLLGNVLPVTKHPFFYSLYVFHLTGGVLQPKYITHDFNLQQA